MEKEEKNETPGSLTISGKSKLFTVEQLAAMSFNKEGKQGVRKEYLFMKIRLGQQLPMNAVAHRLSPKIMVVEIPVSELEKLEESQPKKKGK